MVFTYTWVLHGFCFNWDMVNLLRDAMKTHKELLGINESSENGRNIQYSKEMNERTNEWMNEWLNEWMTLYKRQWYLALKN